MTTNTSYQTLQARLEVAGQNTTGQSLKTAQTYLPTILTNTKGAFINVVTEIHGSLGVWVSVRDWRVRLWFRPDAGLDVLIFHTVCDIMAARTFAPREYSAEQVAGWFTKVIGTEY